MFEYEEADIFTDEDIPSTPNPMDKGYYSIISSYTIRSKSKFNAAVTVHKAEELCVFKITLKGPSYEDSQTVKVQPMTTEYVEFDVPLLNEGDYEIIAEGLQGIIFTKSSPLEFKEYNPLVLIQMDKAIYKPGDLVQFRAVFINENTRPIVMDKPINITIIDPQKNRLKQWKEVQLSTGVYVGKFQLSEQPLLGDWLIDITAEGQTLKTKIFEVEKYVLPKFSVSVESKDVAIHDGVVNVTVRSEYTYGQGVKGKAVITIRPKYNYYYEDNNENMQAEKTIDVNGKGQAQFKIGEDFPIERDRDANMEIIAVMEEELTGNKMEASTSVQLHSNRFWFEGIDNPYEFHPEKPLTLKIAVKTFDYMPVLNSKSPLKLIIEKTRRYYYGEEEEENENKIEEDNVLAVLVSDLDEHGIATFEYTFPDGKEFYYYLKCQYLECESHFTTLSKYKEPEPEYHVIEEPLTVTVLTENPKLNQNVEVEVKTSDPIPYFIYTIHARGKHLKTELIKLPENTKRHIINITPSFEMVPSTNVFVHYVVGIDLRYQSTSITFDRDSENFIDITAPTDVSPGDEVAIEIKSNPESYIGLLGVDQSVLLLKSGNDLDMNDVFNSLERFDNSTSWRSRRACCPGQNSGLLTLTNANYPVFERRRLKKKSAGGCIRYFRSPGSDRSRELEMPDVMECAEEEKSAPTPRIRKQFLESWIFEDIECLTTNSAVLQRTIPDTITSWVITGFSLNPKKGLAITKNPATVKTFRPFFVGTNLPYSIKRGEQITIPVIVFNYMEHDLKADITLENSDDEYDFREPGSDPTKRTKNITVASNTGENVNFTICPKKIGNITLKITAVSPVAGDAIHKELKVEPEGISLFKNRDYYLHTEAAVVDVTNTVKLDIPESVVPDSEFIEVTVMGNILSSTITNIDNLVRMPCGCGEQIMVNFVPNILILWYLESIQELTTTIEEKAKRFLEIGYQSELTYKHDDGSYSAFGKSDPAGSTWLTAYVIRCFHQAKKYIDIDPKILEEGLNFLAKIQAANGCFPENGHVFDSSHMDEVGLTSFVLLAFLENNESMEMYQNTIDRGFDYLQQHLRNTEDVYALSVAVYALQQRKLAVVHDILAKLETLSRIDGGLKYWAKEEKQKKDNNWYVPSHDIEITGYILMTLLDMDMPVLPITRWLISQRNSNGGYCSTQDTVVGLWALIKFAEKNGASNPDMSIEFTTPGLEHPVKTFLVNKDNSMMTQSLELPKDTREITFTGKGTGTAVLQISYRYNILEKEKKPSFKLSTKMKPKTSPALMSMDILTEFTPEDSSENNTSNMVVMEVALPSGYTAVTESLDKIREVEKVKRVETKDDDTSIVVYFDDLKISDEKCIPIEAELSHVVAGQKPVPIVIYDYYDSQKRATEFYEIGNI